MYFAFFLFMNRTLKTLFLIWVSISIADAQDRVSQQTITLFDSTRNRKLVTEIWQPAEKTAAELPLIMFSHGTGGNRLACSWFCEGLASKGFIVAAVDHFGNTYDNPIPKEFVSIWKRPQDISFVLSQLLNEKQTALKIKTSEIFAAGFSLGGYTSLALAGAIIDANELIKFFRTPEGKREIDIPEMPGLIKLFEQDSIMMEFKNNSDLKDKRIQGVFVMAPAVGQGFTSRSQMKGIDVPVSIVGVIGDSIAPIKTNASHYKNLIPNAEWHAVEGNAGHYVFLNVGNDELKKIAPVYFTDAEGVNRAKIHAQVLLQAEKFFNGFSGH